VSPAEVGRLAGTIHNTQDTSQTLIPWIVLYCWCIMRHAYLLPSFAGYSLYLPAEGWFWWSRPGCLVLCQSGLPVLRRSPIQALTWPL